MRSLGWVSIQFMKRGNSDTEMGTHREDEPGNTWRGDGHGTGAVQLQAKDGQGHAAARGKDECSLRAVRESRALPARCLRTSSLRNCEATHSPHSKPPGVLYLFMAPQEATAGMTLMQTLPYSHEHEVVFPFWRAVCQRVSRILKAMI